MVCVCVYKLSACCDYHNGPLPESQQVRRKLHNLFTEQKKSAKTVHKSFKKFR